MSQEKEDVLYEPLLDLQDPYNWGIRRGLVGVGNRVFNPDPNKFNDVTGIVGVGVYQSLLLDHTVQSAFNKTIQDILSADWQIIPRGESDRDLECASFITEQLSSINLQSASRCLLQSYITGLEAVEVIWKKSGNKVIIDRLLPRDPRRICFNLDPETGLYIPQVTTFENWGSGIPIPPRKLVLQRYWLLYSDNPYGYGLGTILTDLVKDKKEQINRQKCYGRKYSNPIPIANIPQNMSIEEANKLLVLLMGLSDRNALVLPKEVNIQFLKPEVNSEAITYLIEYYTKEINLLISTEIEVGQPTTNRASSEVANDLRLTKSKELADELDYTIENTLVRWLAELNYPDVKDTPQFKRVFNKTIDKYQPTVDELVTIKEEFDLNPSQSFLKDYFGIEVEKGASSQTEIEDRAQKIKNYKPRLLDI